jgi:hypothetical protein
MSKSKAPRNSIRGTQARSGGAYDVGYCRPPKGHQFKPGQSGNSKGRPRGAQSEATLLRELLHERIEVQQAGRTRRISTLKALLLRCRNAALGGDLKSLAFLLNRYGLVDGKDPDVQVPLDQDDQALLESFKSDLEAKLKTKKE